MSKRNKRVSTSVQNRFSCRCFKREIATNNSLHLTNTTERMKSYRFAVLGLC